MKLDVTTWTNVQDIVRDRDRILYNHIEDRTFAKVWSSWVGIALPTEETNLVKEALRELRSNGELSDLTIREIEKHNPKKPPITLDSA